MQLSGMKKPREVKGLILEKDRGARWKIKREAELQAGGTSGCRSLVIAAAHYTSTRKYRAAVTVSGRNVCSNTYVIRVRGIIPLLHKY